MAMRLLMVVNDAPFFWSHRLPLAEGAKRRGWDVHVATGPGAHDADIAPRGLTYHPVPALTRAGRNPARELEVVASLARLFRAIRPDVLHLVSIKPVLYGGIVARLVGVPAVVSAVSGLGYVFLARGARANVARGAALAAYRVALGKGRSRTIFQNEDDRKELLGRGVVSPDRTVIIRGSGVDLDVFPARPEPEGGRPLVVLPSRLLWDKGVGELVRAARILRRGGSDARFALVGDTDPNPTTVPRATLEAWSAEGVVEWWGFRDDMPEVLRQASLVCLPSYREGLPKALLEAGATARAAVTTDVPGCRDAVRHEHNGLLVPPRDAHALAEALGRLLSDPALRRRMGAAGRARAEAEFSVERVVDETMAVYEALARPG
jgi:glycosyltransferase involved in cell wall biosynthesis